jgi:hypothetical protein
MYSPPYRTGSHNVHQWTTQSHMHVVNHRALDEVDDRERIAGVSSLLEDTTPCGRAWIFGQDLLPANDASSSFSSTSGSEPFLHHAHALSPSPSAPSYSSLSEQRKATTRYSYAVLPPPTLAATYTPRSMSSDESSPVPVAGCAYHILSSSPMLRDPHVLSASTLTHSSFNCLWFGRTCTCTPIHIFCDVATSGSYAPHRLQRRRGYHSGQDDT